MQNGALGDFMKHYALGLSRVKPEHLIEMPGYGLSLAVLIGSQPHHVGALGLLPQVADELLLLGRNLIDRSIALGHVDAEILLVKVADVPVARHNLVVLTQKLFYCLSLCRRLYYY